MLPLLHLVLAALLGPAAEEPGPESVGQRSVGFVTAIDLAPSGLAPSPGRGPNDDLARVSTFAPGVALHSIGGLSRFTAVAPRWGGEQWFIDGAPANVGLSGDVDDPVMIFDGISKLEIYRSHVPLSYGAAAIGTAIDVVGQLHHGPPRMWFAGGFGSSLTRETQAGVAFAVRPHLSFVARVAYAGSLGNYVHFDDVGTPLLFGDDGYRRRASNNYDTGLAQVRVEHERGGLRVSSQLLGRWRLQGVPGPSGGQPSDVDIFGYSLRSISRIRRSILAPGGYVEWVASLAGDDRRYRDESATFGLAGDDELAMSFDAWTSPRVRLPAWYQGFVTVFAEVRGEWVDVRDRASDLDPAQLSTGEARRTRFTAGVGAELEQWLFDRRWSIAPAFRVDAVVNRFDVPDGEGEVDDRGRNTRVRGFTPRVATKFVLVEGLELRGSAGRHMRLPTLFELFGDRGFARGNEGLQPEGGTRIDGGLLLTLDDIGGRPISVFAQALGFVDWNRDLIQWARDGESVQAINIERARLRGLELASSVRGWRGDAALDVSYRFVDSANGSQGYSRFSADIPGQPRHHLRVRPSGGHRFTPNLVLRASLEPRLFYELEWVSTNTLDVAGYDELPPRLLHALGVSLRVADRAELAVEARNLGNVRWATVNDDGDWPGPYPVATSDSMGFPLPSRSVWASLRVDATWQPKR
jgi:iron complex outermembrane receptor protein